MKGGGRRYIHLGEAGIVRNTVYRALVLSYLPLLSAPASVYAGLADNGGSFTIAALPDTQNYVETAADALLFSQQTQWIADQVNVDGNPRNIQFVTHCLEEQLRQNGIRNNGDCSHFGA